MAEDARLITKDMTMGEIIQKWPEAAEIMQAYGLHCFGCHVNLFESLEQGVMGHGMSEDTMQGLLDDLNKLAAKETKEEANKEEKDLALTELAASKLKELREKRENPSEYSVRVKVVAGGCAGHMYNMDFERDQQANDKILEMHGLKLLIDDQSFRLLKGVTIDYVDSLQGSGFKFNNPNAKAECGCGKSFH